MRRSEIVSNFGYGNSVDANLAVKAARKVALDAKDTDDARLLLDVLGLIPPQLGFEPGDPRETKRERNRRAYRNVQSKKKEEVDKYLESMGITREEIGEPEDS